MAAKSWIPAPLFLLTLCLAGLAPLPADAVTYHVRPDGGTARQCTGRADAPYPGSGVRQACAWKHPFWALRINGDRLSASWKIKGGDTLVVAKGSYEMGIGCPNSDWCSEEWPWDCKLPPVPSGADPRHPTRILGKSWNRGCTDPPELWGTERAESVIDLSGSSNVLIDCLSITDHSSCANNHPDPNVACARGTFPMGPFADTGIYAQDSSNVTLRRLDIHGLAQSGIHAGRVRNWKLTEVRITGNGQAGWDGDIDGKDGNTGAIRFRRVTVAWNGCPERYPAKTPDNCFDQAFGGYGDGLGTGETGGHWIIEDSTVANNTQDGIDLLYVSRVPRKTLIEIRRTRVFGNAGNQIKVNGPTKIENVVAVGNCAWFEGKPFANFMGLLCRAGGSTLSINLGGGHQASVANSTLVGYGDVLAVVQCDHDGGGVCNESDTVVFANNIFRGYGDYGDPGDQSTFIWVDDESDPPFPGKVTGDHNLAWNVKFGETFPSSRDASILIADPRFKDAGIDTLDGHLKAASPAIDTALAVGAMEGLIPDHDFEGVSRPRGAGVDRGAHEYVSP
jgi:hypothetical protein